MTEHNISQDPNSDHISVCICTYKRLDMLTRALDGVASQATENRFSFDVVVVDNDRSRSAESVVKLFQKTKLHKIVYDCEPEQNISLARNRAIANSKGNLIAFIDDDEFPEDKWLLNLYLTLDYSKADGVLGPVIPHLDIQPPEWITKGLLLERPTFKTGTVLEAKYMRTGNVLFLKKIIDFEWKAFDPLFGRTGGEDGAFFRKMTAKGHNFVWCNEAYVYETVPPERLKRSYFIKRGLLRGVSEARLKQCSTMNALKSLFVCLLYTSMLPLLFVLGHHLFMKYLIRDCDHIGKLLALCGIDVLKERDF